MLVLSRLKAQRIFIGDDITITICDIRGMVVRIGIEAPDDVVILREEVHQANVERQRREGRRANDDGPIHPEAVG